MLVKRRGEEASFSLSSPLSPTAHIGHKLFFLSFFIEKKKKMGQVNKNTSALTHVHKVCILWQSLRFVSSHSIPQKNDADFTPRL